ncbi:Histidine--tRNA ligase [Gossypium arboreum]|uniref:Histidine--tRNA ligase n=1 Tax=Gossypium arboreum TaxID=29729 RepID=A0A0B0MXG6_GOSAR|nr:Histidine--tRNA ligase [Gossypium arboreum]
MRASVRPCLGHGIDIETIASVRPCLGYGISLDIPCLGHGIGIETRASCRQASIEDQGMSEALITLSPEAFVIASLNVLIVACIET